MGILGKIFGYEKTTEKALNIADTITTGIVSGFDKVWFTEEEKSEAKQKGQETLLKFWGTFASENSEQSKARRIIAYRIVDLWVYLILLAVICKMFNLDERAAYLWTVVVDITWFVGLIAGTYFVPHQLSKLVSFKK